MSDKTKALFLSPSLSRNIGGIYEIIRHLSLGLQNSGVNVNALGLIDEGWELDRNHWGDIPTKVFRISGPKIFGFSRELRSEVMKSDADILHLHALWMHTSFIANEWGRYTNRPYIVTPNGMLEPWALKNSGWKKYVAAFLYENRMLHGAACLQANTQKELADFRAYGLRNPIAIIPNGIDLPEMPDSRDEGRGSMAKGENGEGKGTRLKSQGENGGRKRLLFLGRIHPKKGLPNALRAFAEMLKANGERLKQECPWQFIIAGWDQGGHEAELMKRCEELGLSFSHKSHEVEGVGKSVESRASRVEGQLSETDVVFFGSAFGEEKKALLRSADAFILSSFSEGLPMSVLEAWAYRLPVLMTPECNLPEGFAVEAAICIEAEVRSITQGMNELFSMSNSDLRSMGDKGYELVKDQFTWQIVARQMREVYDWVLGGGPPPECVRKS